MIQPSDEARMNKDGSFWDIVEQGLRERPWTDLGNAEMFAEVYQDDVRFNHKTQKWIIWGNDRWRVDTNNQIVTLAKVIPRVRYQLAGGITHSDGGKAAAFARRCESLHRLRSMIELAKTEPCISDDGEGWDTDPFLLGVDNGVVDLRTGELRPARREDRITLHTNIPFDLDARCPRWEQFLEEIQNGDKDLIDYMQRAVGYTLTGSVTEQYVHVLFGEGQNGKSVFLNLVSHVLGQHAFTLPFSAFLKASQCGISNDLAASAGKRLVVAAEVDESANLNEARLKSMSGGDTQSARFLFENTFNFKPTAKVWLIVNRKPTVADDSHATWRRIRLIPFTRTFEHADKNLEKTLKQEASGILTWAVIGALMWLNDGLEKAPQAIVDATRSYRSESDVIGHFLTERCVLAAENRIASLDLWQSFKVWCEDQGYAEISQRAFNASLEGRGLRKDLHGEKRIMTWFGLKLMTTGRARLD